MHLYSKDLPRKRKRTKVTFLGNFGQRNLGNEATLAAILHNLQVRLPETDVTCICPNPETTAKTHKISAVPIHEIFVKDQLLQGSFLSKLLRKLILGIPIEIFRWIRAFRFLRRTEMLIVPGTQLLSDNLTGPWGFPYQVFRWSVTAKLQKCKLLFVSVGVGPLSHPLSRFFVKSALLLANFRSYRDDSSRQYLRSIGFYRTGDRVYPDLAFSLPIPIISRRCQGDCEKPVVAVGVIDYRGQFGPSPFQLNADATYRCYLDTVTAFVAWLLEHSYTVRLVIGDVAYDPQVLSDLKKALKDREVRYQDQQLIAEPIETIDELLLQLAASDFVVSPRFHNIVFGLLLNRPIIALSYHGKISALLESFGLARFNVSIDHADASSIIESLCEIMKDSDALGQAISQRVSEYRVKLDEQYDYIVNSLYTE